MQDTVIEGLSETEAKEILYQMAFAHKKRTEILQEKEVKKGEFRRRQSLLKEQFDDLLESPFEKPLIGAEPKNSYVKGLVAKLEYLQTYHAEMLELKAEKVETLKMFDDEYEAYSEIFRKCFDAIMQPKLPGLE